MVQVPFGSVGFHVEYGCSFQLRSERSCGSSQLSGPQRRCASDTRSQTATASISARLAVESPGAPAVLESGIETEQHDRRADHAGQGRKTHGAARGGNDAPSAADLSPRRANQLMSRSMALFPLNV